MGKRSWKSQPTRSLQMEEKSPFPSFSVVSHGIATIQSFFNFFPCPLTSTDGLSWNKAHLSYF